MEKRSVWLLVFIQQFPLHKRGRYVMKPRKKLAEGIEPSFARK
jgi:hypothetical protein